MGKKSQPKKKRAPGLQQTPLLAVGPERISTLKDFLRWLVLREQLEIQQNTPEAQRFAHRWNIFPYEGAIFVGIVTGLSGQEILNRFPELDLPVSLPESEELPAELRELPYKPNIFYFGPFSQEYDNLV
ncbi:MAG: hypothetical protein NZ930_02280 [Candidatus Bipolaricaulota bacterium]|nr:hypothetical protein [Candidatus Bipolaricaulota bacterium]MDW8030885.1 hypothetical protein [Candidatus Bipolaricaulota bacterium]